MSFYVMSSTKWYSAERHSAEFIQVNVILLSDIQVWVILLEVIE